MLKEDVVTVFGQGRAGYEPDPERFQLEVLESDGYTPEDEEWDEFGDMYYELRIRGIVENIELFKQAIKAVEEKYGEKIV